MRDDFSEDHHEAQQVVPHARCFVEDLNDHRRVRADYENDIEQTWYNGVLSQ